MINNIAARLRRGAGRVLAICFTIPCIIDGLGRLCLVIHCLRYVTGCRVMACHQPVSQDQIMLAQKDTGLFVAARVCDIWMKSSRLLFDHRGPFVDVTATKAVMEAEAT